MDSEAPPLVLPLQLNLNNIFGVGMICGFLVAILYGILCLQCYIFFHRFSLECWPLRYSVWLLWALNTLHLTLIIHPLYFYMVTNFDNPLVLLRIPWGLSAGIVVSAVSNLLVQSWYTYRIWKLSSHNRLLTFPLIAAVLAMFGTGIAQFAGTLTLPPLSFFLKLNPDLYTGMVLGIVGDTYLSVVLVVLLRRQQAKVINKRTLSSIQWVMMYTVNTGLISSFVSLGVVIARALAPEDMIYLAIFFISSPIYSNSLMGSLNARDWFKINDPTNNVEADTRDLAFARSDDQSGSTLSTFEAQGRALHVAVNIELDERKTTLQ